MSLYNYTDVIKEVKIGTSGISEVYVGSTKVFPPPVIEKKLTVVNTTGHSGYSIDCDASSTLTQAECRLYDMDYRTFTEASIGSCVESIGDGAFSLYYALSSMTIPSGITHIGRAAFHLCSGMTELIIPDTVVWIEQAAFEYCFSLSSVTIPSGVETINDYTFLSCSGLTSITVPSGVTSIGNSAFQGCSGLTEIVMESATPPMLAGSVFDDTNSCHIKVPCGSLAAYSESPYWYGYTNRLVEDCDFGYKARLMYDNDISKIYEVPCTGDTDTILAEIDWWDSPYPASSLTFVWIGDVVETVDVGCFVDLPNLTGVSFGAHIQDVGSFAFSGCSTLTNISFAESVSNLTIGQSAFQACALGWSLRLPSGVSAIHDFAFYQSTNLHDVYVYDILPPILGSWPFSRMGAGGANILPDNVYVPNGYLQDYQNNAYWSQYNLVEMSE